MDGYDFILLGLVMTPCIAFCLIIWLLISLRERAAKGRLKWLSRRMKGFSLSHAWRWFYRRGIRQGIKIGLRRAEQQSFQRIEVINRCKPHSSDLVAQFVQLSDGRLVQGWFCPDWHGHSLQALPETNSFPAARYMQQVEFRRQATGLIETQEISTIPKPPLKKIKLSS